MLKRLILALVVALFATSGLAACSATDDKNLSGQAAQDALHTVVANSIKKFDKAGGSETIGIGNIQYVVIYDPAAPEGKQVVSANLTDKSAPTFEDPKAVSLHALSSVIDTDPVKKAEVSLTKNVFTIQGTDFLIEIFVTDDLVYKSNVWSTASKSKNAQVVVTTYGIDAQARKLFNSAVEPATAQ